MAISIIIKAYLLGVFLNFANSLTEAVLIAGLAWLAFLATTSLGLIFWEKKSVELYILNNTYSVINYVLMAIIIYSL